MKQHISATTIFPADLLHLRRVAMAMRFVWSTCPQSREAVSHDAMDL